MHDPLRKCKISKSILSSFVAGLKSGFYLSIGAIVVCAVVIVLVLTSSLEAGESSELDLSRGRGLVVAVSSAILIASAIIVVRTRPERATAVGPAPTEDAPVAEALAAGDATPVSDGEDVVDVITSLPEDEQRLYNMISEAGGEMLQMHIVSSGVFSKAKVTRLLDKLENRGLVVRERHGMTNRVRIIR